MQERKNKKHNSSSFCSKNVWGEITLQETHLTHVSILQLGWCEFRTQYHSVHTSYSKVGWGVSIEHVCGKVHLQAD